MDYNDASKTTFNLGYKMTGLAFSNTNMSFNANEFGDVTLNMSTDNLIISSDEDNM
jgi:hypothetical protein